MIDNISDVEPCVGQVDEFPNESTISCGIRKDFTICMILDRKIHRSAQGEKFNVPVSNKSIVYFL